MLYEALLLKWAESKKRPSMQNDFWPLGGALPRLPIGGHLGGAHSMYSALDGHEILHMALASSSSPRRKPSSPEVLAHILES